MARKGKIRVPPLAAFELELGPAETWIARCFEIASAAVEVGLVPGVAVYGHWRGRVSPGGRFNPSLPFQRHGWIVMPDGRIVDLTRWVFEGVRPYVYVGRLTDEYDQGGNQLRAMMMKPCPPYNPADVQVRLNVPAAAWKHVKGLAEGALDGLGKGQMARMQMFWLANLPVQILMPYAAPVYEAIIAIGAGALIPWDNQEMFKRGEL